MKRDNSSSSIISNPKKSIHFSSQLLNNFQNTTIEKLEKDNKREQYKSVTPSRKIQIDQNNDKSIFNDNNITAIEDDTRVKKSKFNKEKD